MELTGIQHRNAGGGERQILAVDKKDAASAFAVPYLHAIVMMQAFNGLALRLMIFNHQPSGIFLK